MTLDERIARYLEKCPPAVTGSREHDQAFTVACALVNGFALDEADALRHFLTYNATCCPPWSPRELRHKIMQAGKVAHTKGRGHLLGGVASRPARSNQAAAKPVPVRLTAKRRRLRTGRTTFFNPYAYAGEKVVPPYIQGVDAKSSEASEPAQVRSNEQTDVILRTDAELFEETFGALRVPGCHLARPEEIVCSDATWRALNAHPLGGEPLVHLALSLFGPDATILSTKEPPCA